MFLHLLSPVLQCSAVLSDFFFPSPPIFLRPFSFPQSSYVPPLFLLSPFPSPPMLLKTSPFPIVLLCSSVLSPCASPPMFLSSFSFCQSSYVPQFFLLSPVLLCSSVLSIFAFPSLLLRFSPFHSHPVFLRSFFFP